MKHIHGNSYCLRYCEILESWQCNECNGNNSVYKIYFMKNKCHDSNSVTDIPLHYGSTYA